MPYWNVSIYINATGSHILNWLNRNVEFPPPEVPDMRRVFSRRGSHDSLTLLGPGEGELYEREIVDFETVPVTDARTQLRVRWRGETAEAYALALLEAMAKSWLELKGQMEPEKRGPTLKTQERAKLYQKLKNAHPEWSLAQVAIRANMEERSQDHTEDTVRNAYRQMGWPWERADRVR